MFSLEDSQQLLEKIFASLHEAIFVVDHETSRIVDCNPAALEMFGFTREEMIGAPALVTHVDESSLEKFRKLLYRATEKKGFLFLREFNLKRKNGTVFPAEHHVRPLEDEQGKIVGWVSAVTDITRRKAAEEALRKSTKKARRLAKENAIFAEIGRIIGSTLEIERVYEAFARKVAELIRFDRISVCVIDPSSQSYTISYAAGAPFLGHDKNCSFPLAGTSVGEILRTCSSFIFQRGNDMGSNIPFSDTRAAFQAGFASIISVPLISSDQAIGALHVLSKKTRLYTRQEVELTERVGNQIAGAIANARLFAELSKAQEALHMEKQNFQLLVENAPFGILVADGKHQTKYLNPRFEELFGYDIGDIPGADAWFEKAFPDSAYREHRITTWSEDIASLARARAVSKTIKVICKDGKEKVVDVTGVALDKGEYMFVCEDITERRRAETALVESEERYRTAIEHCNDGVLIARDMQNVFVNRRLAQMFGYERPEELVGKTFSLLVHPDEIGRVEDALRIIMRGEKHSGQRQEIKGIRRDGEAIDVELSCTRIVYRGQPACLAYLRDITDAKAAERERIMLQEQIRQSQKMEAIGRLAGGIAHDFNNLLTVIKGYSEIALGELEESNPLKSSLQEIQDAAQRASDLTSRLLAFSRRQIMEMKVIDINSLVRNLDRMLRRVIGEDIELVTMLREDLGAVKADPAQIEHVIMNLAVNARDAMPGGGKLIIETANVDIDAIHGEISADLAPGRYVMLSIYDTGCGMTPEIKERIFEPFFTTKEKGKGTGLGLSMAYGIVKQSGGTIQVDSEPGKGSIFKIFLPRIDGTQPIPANEIKAGDMARGSETILLVEDEKQVMQLVAMMLKKLGYQVLEAANVEEALAVFERHRGPIHMVISDVVLPKMRGPELIERLKRLRSDFKVLYMSGYTDSSIAASEMAENGLDYLQKPFTLEDLAQKMRQILDSA